MPKNKPKNKHGKNKGDRVNLLSCFRSEISKRKTKAIDIKEDIVKYNKDLCAILEFLRSNLINASGGNEEVTDFNEVLATGIENENFQSLIAHLKTEADGLCKKYPDFGFDEIVSKSEAMASERKRKRAGNVRSDDSTPMLGDFEDSPCKTGLSQSKKMKTSDEPRAESAASKATAKLHGDMKNNPIEIHEMQQSPTQKLKNHSQYTVPNRSVNIEMKVLTNRSGQLKDEHSTHSHESRSKNTSQINYAGGIPHQKAKGQPSHFKCASKNIDHIPLLHETVVSDEGMTPFDIDSSRRRVKTVPNTNVDVKGDEIQSKPNTYAPATKENLIEKEEYTNEPYPGKHEMESNVRTMKDEIKAYKQILKDKENEITELREQLEIKSAQLSKLQQCKIKSPEGLNIDAPAYFHDQGAEQKQNENKELAGPQEKQRIALKEEVAQNQECQDMVSATTECHVEIETLKTKQDEKQIEMDNLKATNKDREKHEKEMEALNTEINSKSGIIREKDKIISMLNEEKDKQQKQIQSLEETNGEMIKQIEMLKEEKNKTSFDSQNDKGTIERLEAALHESKQDVTKLKGTTVDALNNSVFDKKAQIHELEIILADKESEIASMRNRTEKILKNPLPKKTVQIYCRGENTLSVWVTNVLSEHLQSELGDEDIQLLLHHTLANVKPNLPTLCCCIKTSRIGTDVNNAVRDLQLNSNVILVIFHHQAVHSLPATASRHILTDPKFKPLGTGIFDLVFENTKLHDCSMNARNLADIIEFLRTLLSAPSCSD